MTIYQSSLTGYGVQSRVMKYTSVFNSGFEVCSPMRFYQDDISKITDISLNKEGGLVICIYPHNETVKIKDTAFKFETEIKKLLKKLIFENPGREDFTVEFTENGVRPITKQDFSGYYPSDREVKTEIFIFENAQDTEDAFPRIFVVESSIQSHYGKGLLKLYALASHYIADYTAQPTLDGRRFTHNLLKSFVYGKFVSEVPDLQNLHFPTRGTAEISPIFNITELLKFTDKIGAEKVMANGTYTEETPLLPAALPPETPKELSVLIEKQIKDSASVNLLDMLTLGVTKVLEITRGFGSAISVNIDSVGVAKKMTILEGMIHMIPSGEADPEEVLGISGDKIVCHVTPDTFPNI